MDGSRYRGYILSEVSLLSCLGPLVSMSWLGLGETAATSYEEGMV